MSQDEEAGREGPATLALVSTLTGLGLVTSGSIVGAVFFVALGELLRIADDRAESFRGRGYFVLVGVAFGLLAWFPEPAGVLLRSALALALVPLWPMAPQLADASVPFHTALARSIDGTLRARTRDLSPALTLGAFFALTPCVVSLVWLVERERRPPIGTLAAAVACVAVAALLAAPACVAVSALSTASTDRARHSRPTTRLGVALVAAMVLAAGWTGAALAAVSVHGAWPVVAYPVGATLEEGRATVWMERADGGEFGVAMAHDARGWSLVVDPLSESIADTQIAVSHLAIAASSLPVFALLAALVWARGGALRRWLLRSHVVPARFRESELDHGSSAPRLREGASLALAGGTLVRLTSPLPIESTHRAQAIDGWVECAIIAPRAWSPDGSYRESPPPPPSGSRVLLGAPADAVVAARIGDIEQSLTYAAFGVPAVMFLAAIGWVRVASSL